MILIKDSYRADIDGRVQVVIPRSDSTAKNTGLLVSGLYISILHNKFRGGP